MGNEQVSVIVPVYNVEKFLRRCVDSILAQTYDKIEVILVDDGSTDKSGDICDEYGRIDNRIRVFHKENNNEEARNVGVNNATSPWVVFVDSDDYVEPQYVENLVGLREKFNSDIAVNKAFRRYIDDENNVEKKNKFDDFVKGREDALFEIYAGDKAAFTLWGKIFKRDLLLRNPLKKGLAEDFRGMLPIVCDCDAVAFGDYRYNYHYIFREASYVSKEFDRKRLLLFDDCTKMREYLFREIGKNMDTEVLSVVFFQLIVLNLLNLQTINNDDFKYVFHLYRNYFRRNTIKVIRNKRINLKTKIFNLLLCGSWRVFLIQKSMRKHTGT